MSTKAVRTQYEKFPYPPVGMLALPVRGEGHEIAIPSARRILVAGCGTLEAVVAAQANPRARITAVDLSASSLRIARTRLTLMKLARPFSRIARVDWIRADLLEWTPTRNPDDKFDFILCSNVIHHVESPAALLARLATWLDRDGVLRFVTYPKASRIWMRQAALWLRLSGLTRETAGLPARARAEIRKLPENHPARVIFESHPELNRGANITGLIDGFFHAQERPLSPLEWREACAASGLELFRESQTETSQSRFLDEILHEELSLDPWSKLEVLDCLLEVCANPVLWLRHSASARGLAGFARANAPAAVRSTDEFLKPASYEFELGRNLRRARDILQSAGIPIERVMQALVSEVGPRVGPPPDEKPLPGLSILDYDWRRML